jgi:Na+/H+ antiporter NhaD/arsenite permease-like protein
MNEFSQGPVLWQTIACILIFAAAYVLILAEVWNRTYIALAGALLMLGLGLVPFQQAFTEYISWNTLFLLAGLYIVSNFFRKTGLFSFVAAHLIRRTSAKPLSVLLLLGLISAVGCAFFDGILVIVALVPFTINAARILKVSSVPFVVAVILMANLGGMATWIGNAPNRLIGTYADFTFVHIIFALGPLVAGLMIVVLASLAWIYRKQFVVAEDRKQHLLSLPTSDYVADRQLLIKGGIVAGLMLLGFILQGNLRIQAGMIALAGALLICIVDYKDMNRILKQRDYVRLFHGIIDSQFLFFMGLFIMVGGFVNLGVSGFAAARWVEITQGSLPFAALFLLWITGLGSAAVDSIPYTAAMLPIVKEAGQLLGLTSGRSMDALWLALSIGAGIGGGGTLMGSYLNMVAAGIADEEGERLSQWGYFKIAGLLTLLMLVVATIYLNIFLL